MPLQTHSLTARSIPQKITLTISSFVVLFFIFGIYVFSEKQIDRANERRQHSLAIADQLRQSSDDLTQMARTFVATGDPIYRQYYQEILDIRNGKRNRPKEYFYPYWDLVMAQVLPHRQNQGQAIALLELFRQTGATEAEIAMLTEAKAHSDALASLEWTAINLASAEGPDSTTKRAQALRMMHDDHYHREKAKIMQPIKAFIETMDQRTAAEVQSAERFAFAFRIVFIACALAALFSLWRTYGSLRSTLGGPVQDIHEHLRRIGRGDLTENIDVPQGKESSILAGLAAMQLKLGTMEAERAQVVAKLKASEARLNSLFVATPDALLISDANGVITMANQQVEQLLGYGVAELIGQSIEILVPQRVRDHHPSQRKKFAEKKEARRMGSELPVTARHKDGSELAVEISLSRIQTDEGVFFASSIRDISRRKKIEEKINSLAFFDQLTLLPNRTLLLDRLNQAMTAGVRSARYGAVLFIDLDNFKSINDTLGHDTGDLLLQQVAERLTQCVRAEDTVARLGGDEFVVVLTNLDANENDAAAKAEVVGGKIITALNQPYTLNGTNHRSSPSIGATLFRGHLASIDDLLKQADMAMYKSKASGRNTLRFFDPEMERAVNKRVSLESDLREALKQGQFLLHYQAQIGNGGQLTGAEVLLRWQHPQRCMVSPADFIPIAEETALILPIGLWVLETACNQLAAWAEHPAMDGLSIAVNVSAQQFRQTNFVDQVLGVLQQTGANPKRLKLELTESLLVHDVEEIIEKMFLLRAKGVEFSLDDFGTGYSSLSYLKRMPLDQLKIDQSFVRDMLSNHNDASIAKTIIALSQSLGLNVIAEGVETEAQRDFLTASGCHAYQGYFFSRPLPLTAFEQFAQEHPGHPEVRPTSFPVGG